MPAYVTYIRPTEGIITDLNEVIDGENHFVRIGMCYNQQFEIDRKDVEEIDIETGKVDHVFTEQVSFSSGSFNFDDGIAEHLYTDYNGKDCDVCLKTIESGQSAIFMTNIRAAIKSKASGKDKSDITISGKKVVRDASEIVSFWDIE